MMWFKTQLDHAQLLLLGADMATSVKVSSSPARKRPTTPSSEDNMAVVERRVATPRSDLVIIKIGERYKKELLSPRERASGLLAAVGKVMSKPGANRQRVFRSVSGRPVYAYSIDPQDTSRVIREDVNGDRTVGRLVSGKFRATSAV